MIPGFIIPKSEINSDDNNLSLSIDSYSERCESFCRNHVCNMIESICERYGESSSRCQSAITRCLNCYKGC